MKKTFIAFLLVFGTLVFSSSLSAADCDDLPVLNGQLQLHIPFIQLAGGSRVWADFEFVPTGNDLLAFCLTDYGMLQRDFRCDAEDQVTIDSQLQISIPHLLFRDQDNLDRDSDFWLYMVLVSPDDPIPDKPNPDTCSDVTFKITNFGPWIVHEPAKCEYQGTIELSYVTYEPLHINAATRLPFCVSPGGAVTIGGGTMSYYDKKDLGEVIMSRKGTISLSPTGRLGNVPGTGDQPVSGLVVDLHGKVQEHIEIKTHSGRVLVSEDPSGEWEYAIITFPIVRDWVISVSNNGRIENYPIAPGEIATVPLVDYVMGILRLYP